MYISLYSAEADTDTIVKLNRFDVKSFDNQTKCNINSNS